MSVQTDNGRTHTSSTPPTPASTPSSSGRGRPPSALRALDQEAVDRIVWAMVVAGLEHAVDLAELAMEETGFGVLEDKVVKNYIATEFLYDYLKDKRSVGVIDEDAERGIQYVAEPIGVVLALLPITNPTSTALFKAIVAAKTRNAMIFRPSARAARCAHAGGRDPPARPARQAGLPPGRAPGRPRPDARRLAVPLPPRRASTSSGRPAGPKAVAGDQRGRQAVHRRRPRQRAGLRPPQRRRPDGGRRHPDLEDVRRVGDLPGRADARRRRRRSTTRSSPSSSAWARASSTADEADALAAVAFEDDGRARMEALGHSCVDLAALAGIAADERDKVLRRAAAGGPRRARRAPARCSEKLMPVLGLVRSPSVEHAIAACELVTEHGGLGHTSARLRRRRGRRSRASPSAIRTGRILVNAPTAVGALGGVYNSMTPTFSLGCGTWGGSMTTDNVNYRNLLNIKTVSRRQTPPQWFRVPSDTYFNAGAIENLRELEASTVADRHRRRHRGARRGRRGPPPPRHGAACTCSPTSSPSRPRRRSAPASRCSATRRRT